MIHLLTAHTRAGKLYDVDMRLRPSGSAGPLVSHVDAFRDYHASESWTWENQAIVRARPVAGDPELASGFESVRSEVLTRRRDRKRLRREVVEMREKLRSQHHRAAAEGFELKQDPGGIVDIEFLVQYLILGHAHGHEALTRWPDNVRQLVSLIRTGVVDNPTAHRLKHVYLIYRAMAHRLSLLEKPAVVHEERFRLHRDTVRGIWKRLMRPDSTA
jgi:glutamate-ammonia-ligase adenylyltransferase